MFEKFDVLTKVRVQTEKQMLLVQLLLEINVLLNSDLDVKAEEKFNSDRRLNNPPYRDRNKLFYTLGYADCISDISKMLEKYVKENK